MSPSTAPHSFLLQKDLFQSSSSPLSQLDLQELRGSQTGLRAKSGGGAPSCPWHPCTFLSTPLPSHAVWAFSEHLGSYEPWTAPAEWRGPLRCALPPALELCRGSGSTSQPLLLQCPALSLGFYLCSVVPTLSLSLSFSAVSASFPGVWRGVRVEG